MTTEAYTKKLKFKTITPKIPLVALVSCVTSHPRALWNHSKAWVSPQTSRQI
jgi:hypothetical protein